MGSFGDQDQQEVYLIARLSAVLTCCFTHHPQPGVTLTFIDYHWLTYQHHIKSCMIDWQFLVYCNKHLLISPLSHSLFPVFLKCRYMILAQVTGRQFPQVLFLQTLLETEYHSRSEPIVCHKWWKGGKKLRACILQSIWIEGWLFCKQDLSPLVVIT